MTSNQGFSCAYCGSTEINPKLNFRGNNYCNFLHQYWDQKLLTWSGSIVLLAVAFFLYASGSTWTWRDLPVYGVWGLIGGILLVIAIVGLFNKPEQVE